VLVIVLASTECKISLIHHLAVESRCDDIRWLCHGSVDEIPLAFSLRFFLFCKWSKTGGV